MRRSKPVSGVLYHVEVQIIAANGPAIKCVCVAERMKAGAVSPNRGNVPAPAGMSEAWRGFWLHGTNFRAYTSVAVQVLGGASIESRYRSLIVSTGAMSGFKI